MLFRDLIAFRKNASHGISIDADVAKKGKECSGFVKVQYHNKGIEMIGLPQILRSGYVKSAVPQFKTESLLWLVTCTLGLYQARYLIRGV